MLFDNNPFLPELPALAQVINRAKLQRAGKDNLFVRLLYGKDAPRNLQSIKEQERLGKGRPKVAFLLAQRQNSCMYLKLIACFGDSAVHDLKILTCFDRVVANVSAGSVLFA